MTLVEIPFYADDAILPEKLPTCSEVRSSTDILEDKFAHRVVGVGKHFVAKFGKDISFMEGQNMLYVSQATSISVPRLYAMFTDTQTGENYIVMERVHGQRLDGEWNALSEHEKEVTASKLKRYVTELRVLPSPGVFCSLGHRPLLHNFFQQVSAASWAGPFETEADLNEALILNYEHVERSDSARCRQKSSFYRRMFPHLLGDHRAVFTHADLQLKNILIRRCAEGKLAVTLIDWEYSGWYPCYWEYANALSACTWLRNNWSDYLDTIVPKRWSEVGFIQTLFTDLSVAG